MGSRGSGDLFDRTRKLMTEKIKKQADATRPPPPTDEADAAPMARQLAQRKALSALGFRATFLAGARGPGGPAWKPPEQEILVPAGKDYNAPHPGTRPAASPGPVSDKSTDLLDSRPQRNARRNKYLLT